MKRQKVDDGPVAPLMAPAIEVTWLFGVTCRTISESWCSYRPYYGDIEDDARQPADVPANAVDILDGISVQDDFFRSETVDRPLQPTLVQLLSL